MSADIDDGCGAEAQISETEIRGAFEVPKRSIDGSALETATGKAINDRAGASPINVDKGLHSRRIALFRAAAKPWLRSQAPASLPSGHDDKNAAAANLPG